MVLGYVLMRIRAYLLDIEPEGGKPSALYQNPVTISFSEKSPPNHFPPNRRPQKSSANRRQIVQKSSATREVPSRARFADDLPTICQRFADDLPKICSRSIDLDGRESLKCQNRGAKKAKNMKPWSLGFSLNFAHLVGNQW